MRSAVEPQESDAERLAWLRRELQTGLDDLSAGKVSNGKVVFAELKKRFPSTTPRGSAPYEQESQ